MRSVGTRRLGSLGTIVLLAAVLVGAAQRDPLPAPGATVRSPASATAWLPDPRVDARHLVLADSDLERPRATVDVRASVPSATAIAQAGDNAVVASDGRVFVVSGRTWSVSIVSVPSPSSVEVVASPSTAWLLPSGRGGRHVLRPLDLRSAPARLGAPIPIDGAIARASARVDREGRLWVLRPDRLEVFGRDGRIGAVPLGEPTPRALTLVDDRPVVIEHARARPIEAATLTVGADWPLSLGPGPIVAADHSRGIAVVRTPTRLAVVGASTPARALAVPVDPSPAAPVEHGGRVFLTRWSGDGITVVDPARPDAGLDLAVPAPGELRIFEHAGHVWYARTGAEGASGQIGVITPNLTARPIQVGSDPGGDGPGDGPGDGRGDASSPTGAGELPSTPRQVPDDRRRIPLPDEVGSCARTSRARDCLPDPDQLRPGAPPGPGAGACPRTWDPDRCLTERTGVPTGPTGPGQPAPPSEPTAPRITWDPPSPKVGDQVRLDITGGPPGARRWTIGGIDRPDRPEAAPLVTWHKTGDHPVSVTVGDNTLHATVHVSRQVVPNIAGYTVDAAIRALEGVGLTVTPNRRDVPSVYPAGAAQGVRAKNAIIEPGTPIDEGFAVDLDISDGTKPVAEMDGDIATCVVTPDGDVYCVGGDPTLNLGSTEPNRFVRVMLPGKAKDIAVGWQHACAALLDGGAVWCWGDNSIGQLGHAGAATASQPVPVDGLTNVDEIDAAGDSTCARRSGKVWCWGLALVEEGAEEVGDDLGRRANLTPRPVPNVDGATALSVGGHHGCAIVGSGVVRCWGMNDAGQLGRRPGFGEDGFPGATAVYGAEDVRYEDGTPLRGVDEIAVGELLSCGRTRGSLVCWGTLERQDFVDPGQWPPPDPTSRPVAVPSGAGVTSLSANGMNVCGTRTDGTIWCNWMTTLGGFPSADLEPIRLPGPGGAIAVLESNGYTCGLLDDRSLHCVGYVPGTPLFEPLLTPTRLPVIAG